MNGVDPTFLQQLLAMFPQLAGIAAQNPVQAPQSPQATTPAGGPSAAPLGGLGGLGGLPQPPRNEWAPDNATDIMWLQQNNPQQLMTNGQIEASQPGYDPAKAKWGYYMNQANGMGQATMDRDMANITGTWHGSRS